MRLTRLPRVLAPLIAAGALAAGPASAAQVHHNGTHHYRWADKPVRLRVITPGAGDVAGAGGVFNIDLSLQARNSAGNQALSRANGYVPFLNNAGSRTFGPGKPDPGAPGLVVTLSTTPQMAGGASANLAGVFQLNAVNRHHGRIGTFNDWQVGVPGFFGLDKQTTLTAYAVRGTAPGTVPAGGLTPISNVVRRTFTIAG